MVNTEELKQIVILSHFTDEMIRRLQTLIELWTFSEGDIIFKEGGIANHFFMLKRGKVLLEQTLSDTMTVSLASIKPGFAFGWSSMLEGERYTANAICAETCEVLAIRGDALKSFLNKDHAMGHLFYQRLLVVLKKRYDLRTEQFVRAIRNHPDIQSLQKANRAEDS